MPTRLRDAGVKKEQFAQIARRGGQHVGEEQPSGRSTGEAGWEVVEEAW